MLVDTVRNVAAEAVVLDLAPEMNDWAMKRPMYCPAGVLISITHVFKVARHGPSADRVVIAGRIVTHLYSTKMI
jgi:hypothetical protein